MGCKNDKEVQKSTEVDLKPQQLESDKQSQSNQLILGYWQNRGRAQAKYPYEDKRYTFDAPQEWFGKDKVIYQDNLLANIPYIKDGEKIIFETIALATYVCYKSDRLELLGSNMQEQVALEAIYSVLLDIQTVNYKYFVPPKRQEDYVKENFLTDIKPLLAKLDFLIKGKQWATGNNITYIDFHLFEASEFVRSIDQETFNSYPDIVALNQKVSDLPQISVLQKIEFYLFYFFQKYIESDQFIKAPFLVWC